MSTKYKHSHEVPTAVLAKRLDELSDAVGKTGEERDRELTRRVPAELDRDADLVLLEAATRLLKMEAQLARADDRAHRQRELEAQLQGELNGLESVLALTEAQRYELATQHGAMAVFINEAINACFDGGNLDGSWIQERGEELGLLEAVVYDPAVHHIDCEITEPGEKIYVRTAWLGTKVETSGRVGC